MTLIELLAIADTPVVADLTAGGPDAVAAAGFDNRPTWDNWPNKS